MLLFVIVVSFTSFDSIKSYVSSLEFSKFFIKNSNKYVYEYGETTNFIKKEEDINYIMNNLIETMKQKWDKYENDYDNIYGEGVYANKFRLPPDDLTSEEQNNSDEYDSDEDNSNEYYSNE